MRLFSFRAFSYDAHFHSTPSLITPIFIPRLLLRHLFSFPAFSYDAYYHSLPTPIALVFILRILLILIVSLCKYQHKLSQCLEQLEPFPLLSLVGGASTPPVLQKPNTAGQVNCLGMKDVRGSCLPSNPCRDYPPPNLIRISPHPRHAPSCLDK